MLNEARADMVVAPHVAVFPSLAIFLTVLMFNLFGDGLRDARPQDRSGNSHGRILSPRRHAAGGPLEHRESPTWAQSASGTARWTGETSTPA